jgi:hypothetical protein
MAEGDYRIRHRKEVNERQKDWRDSIDKKSIGGKQGSAPKAN